MRRTALLLFLIAIFAAPAHADDSAADLLAKARAALKEMKVEAAITFLDKAIAADPKNLESLSLRGSLREALGQYDKAIEDMTRVLELSPKAAAVYNQRGSARFKAGKIKESVEDFDKFLELRPDEKPGHWRRGISLYYAGQFDEGRKQFEGYEKVDTNDVENAVWHFLCVARKDGVDRARGSILKIGKDKRVPMMQVYELFAGKLKPEEVLAAVRTGEPNAAELNARLFYAHLYLGLFAEVNGDKKLALEHLNKATEEHHIAHYMWDVARVHRDLLKK